MRRGPSWFNITALALGFAFLYVPIAILVIYSFNASRLVTVWGGFSTRWYVALMHDAAMLDAAWVTLRIGLVSAAAATVLRSPRWRWCASAAFAGGFCSAA
jgi:putrescine transport system permease protein